MAADKSYAHQAQIAGSPQGGYGWRLFPRSQLLGSKNRSPRATRPLARAVILTPASGRRMWIPEEFEITMNEKAVIRLDGASEYPCAEVLKDRNRQLHRCRPDRDCARENRPMAASAGP